MVWYGDGSFSGQTDEVFLTEKNRLLIKDCQFLNFENQQSEIVIPWCRPRYS